MDLLTSEIHHESVKELLMQKGLALREELIRKEVVEEREIFRWRSPAFPTTAKFQGQIHHVDWSGRLYVTAEEVSKEKEKIDTALNVTHNNSFPGHETGWEVGEACIARFHLDFNW